MQIYILCDIIPCSPLKVSEEHLASMKMERKVFGDVHIRKGPNRIRFIGLLPEDEGDILLRNTNGLHGIISQKVQLLYFQ
jgi:hypothetical protein